MKITTKVLCQRSSGPLSKALHLDLSSLGIGTVEGLEHCINVQSLDLSNNCLEEFENFESCKHLWRINLCNNQISCLDGFSKIFALGTLDLSNNLLPWKELAQLQSVHVLDLHLHGNPELENDTYYRMHVIDCLPNIWMLDGRLVTSAERLQVRQFFDESALSNRPVRHKLKERPIQNLRSSRSKTVHGNRASYFSANFSRNESHNSDNDKRRLEFLAKNMQQDLQIRSDAVRNGKGIRIPEDCLAKLVQLRYKDKERCNMLLLMLISSIEFKLPLDLVKQTLEVTKLNPMFDVDTLQLFSLDQRSRTEVIAVLVSACKLDRDVKRPSSSHFSSGGLYDRLYLCLYHAVAHLIKVVSKSGKKPNNWLDYVNTRRELTSRKSRPHTAPPRMRSFRHQSKLRNEWKAHQRLLGSELVLLLSVVPVFYHYITQCNPSVCELLFVATGDSELASRLAALSSQLSVEGGNIDALYKEISNSVRRRIEFAAHSSTDDHIVAGISREDPSQPIYLDVGRLSSNTKQSRIILNAADSYPKRPKSGVLTSSEFLTVGKRRTVNVSEDESVSNNFNSHQTLLSLGSEVLLGAQNLARVIAMPEPHVALVQMDSVPASNGSVVVQTRNLEEHFCYIDVTLLEYDPPTGYWKPHGAVGDRVTLQTPNTLAKDAGSFETDRALAMIESEQNLAIDWRTEVEPRKSANMQMQSVSIDEQTRKPLPRPKKNEPSSPKAVGKNTKEAKSPTVLRPLSSMFCEKIELTLSDAIIQSGVHPSLASRGTAADALTERKELRAASTFITQHPGSLDDWQSGTGSNSENIERGSYGRHSGVDHLTEGEHGVERRTSPGTERAFAKIAVMRDNETHQETFDGSGSLCSDRGAAVEPDGDETFDGSSRQQWQEISGNESIEVGEEAEATSGERSQVVSKDTVTERPRDVVEISLPRATAFDVEEVAEAERDAGEMFVKSEEKYDSRRRRSSTDNVPEFKVTNITIELQSRPPHPDRGPADLPVTVAHKRKPIELMSRRVQSARFPRKPSLLKRETRPSSAAVSRTKHVAFDDKDTDLRPGSASSFQLRRTEAWRSSASSGSVGLGMASDQEVSHVKSFVVDTRGENNPLRAKSRFGGVRRPPPQRPTSPNQLTVDGLRSDMLVSGDVGNHHSIDGDDGLRDSVNLALQSPALSRLTSASQVAQCAGGSPVLTSNWLAEGRNLHKEHEVMRKLITSPRLPGYLVGTSMIPTKTKKPDDRSFSAVRSDVAVHLLPSRPAKPFARLPHTSYGRAFDHGQSVASASLGGALVWNRPRFSALSDIKKLSAKPGTRLTDRASRNRLPRQYK